MATGVLVLLVGEATKLCSVLGGDDKVYRARVRFGYSTDTDDALGSPIATARVEPQLLSAANVERALCIERERSLQVPPAFSAIKAGGQPLYKKARLGIAVIAEPRPVSVISLELLESGEDYVDLEVQSSKGYYVRALARDLGIALKCPAHLSSLRRIRAGCYSLEQAHEWPPVSLPTLSPLSDVVKAAMPCFELTELGAQRARQGQTLTTEHFAPGRRPTPTDHSMGWLFRDQLIAIGRWQDSDSLIVERGFNV
jgi:tRNA pseudouridine55 synthase